MSKPLPDTYLCCALQLAPRLYLSPRLTPRLTPRLDATAWRHACTPSHGKLHMSKVSLGFVLRKEHELAYRTTYEGFVKSSPACFGRPWP